jgi:hypothetical protein
MASTAALVSAYTAIGLGSPQTDTIVRALAAAGPAAGIYGARVSGGWYQQLTDRIGLSATADVAGEHHAQFTGLDYAGLGGSLALRGKLGLGLNAPWWRLGGNLMARDYDFDLRDGQDLRVRHGRSLDADKSHGQSKKLISRVARPASRLSSKTDSPSLRPRALEKPGV